MASIGVKNVEEDDRISLWRAIGSCCSWNRKVDSLGLSVINVVDIMWPVCLFPGQAQQHSDSRYYYYYGVFISFSR